MYGEAMAKQLQTKSMRVRGVLHLAGILDDALLSAMTRQHFERAYGPKARALETETEREAERERERESSIHQRCTKSSCCQGSVFAAS